MTSKPLTLSSIDVTAQPLPHSIDVIVVGTGPGGASTAKFLAESGLSVVMLEWGDAAPLTGQFSQMAAIAAVPGKGAFVHTDLSLLLRGITTGGTSAINFATAVSPPHALFDRYGVDLRAAEAALRQQLPLHTLPDHLMGPMAKRIASAAVAAGHNWQKLEKYIHVDQCRAACHRCTYGCPFDAKWSAREFVEAASQSSANLVVGAKVTQVLIKKGVAVGVEYRQHGQRRQLFAGKVVLAAGGIGTPRILQNSGFSRAGDNYFVDPVIAVMGSVDDLRLEKQQLAGQEVPMAAGLALPEQGITLSDLTLPRPLFQAFSAQVGRFDRVLSHKKTLSIMVKIKDDPSGRIGPHWLNKTLSEADRERFNIGTDMANNILRAAGARHIYNSHHFAAHPGGGAKIGELVDEHLETAVKGLFVCDASVIPEAWGIAPSLTLMCLGHRLAQQLTAR